ncbi:unnamed protein product [Kluyveromyces dobzhanskii CBS 2104]|uniref:Thymidylate kinase n=1 Tax=Kluyveromyces dobzhanskii CBS 2104 TaxID=1427455 RepID=A0A0A8L2G9_9SACH|nr:unnamed protein product [Kluyveromyces dobzhanskii CBS 2104]
MARGKLILIEGLDRTGKSTQSEKILSALGDEAVLLKFPDRTTRIGELINQYLTDSNFELPAQSIHLLFSANRWELNSEIHSLLEAGKHVILDRYVYSGVAYSAAKEIPGMDISWCFNPDKGLLKPDLTLFFSNQDSSSLQDREGFGEERYEKIEFQKRVRHTFSNVFDHISDPNRAIVDVSDRSIEEVFRYIEPLFRTVINKDLEGFTYF